MVINLLIFAGDSSEISPVKRRKRGDVNKIITYLRFNNLKRRREEKFCKDIFVNL